VAPLERKKVLSCSLLALAASCFFFGVISYEARPQETTQKPQETQPEKQPAKPEEKNRQPEPSTDPQFPAQFSLLETRVRFEANGDSRKEVHAVVKINNELGVHQFARLNFDYNRSFQSVEIPLVRITHANGGTADILPSAISDNPNPAVVNAPAYQDVRVKSVRILGLEPGDMLEYRIITTVSHHPLAPEFWLDHSFDRSGVVSEEHFQVVLPAAILAKSTPIIVKNERDKLELESRLGPEPGCGLCGGNSTPPLRLTPPKPAKESLPQAEYGKVQLIAKESVSRASIEKSGDGAGAKVTYTWQNKSAPRESRQTEDSPALKDLPDIEIGRTSRWPELSFKLYRMLSLPQQLPESVIALSKQLTAGAETPLAKSEAIYDFVAKKIRTVDLPLGTTGFKPRALEDIFSSGYATQEDKFFLFQALAKAANLDAQAALIGTARKINALTTNPAAFSHLVIGHSACNCWLDPSLEVAPFGALPASYRGSSSLILGVDYGPIVDAPASSMIVQIPKDLPFAATQQVRIDATLTADGKLTAKVRYAMRGDNELLLRVAFHQAPRERWNEVAQLLALSDGFRGKIVSATASDPYATKEPFTVEYEIEQPRFLDWSKKSLRIPALLPLLGLPDLPPPPAPGAAPSPIELGTPLDVETTATLHLPSGTTARVPTGTSVERDYATFTSQYAAHDNILTASRHIHFLLRQVPAARAVDYNAFLHAVQSDQAQYFTLDHPPAPASQPSVAPHESSPASKPSHSSPSSP
jgi:hypothetical protein